MGSVPSSRTGSDVADREWLRLGSELNLLESALYSNLNFSVSSSSHHGCKYCKDHRHASSECTVAVRAGLIKFEDDEESADAGAQPITTLALVNQLEGLLEARPGDRAVADQLLSRNLFAYSLESSSFNKVASLRAKLVQRLRQAVDRLNLQSSDRGSGGADSAGSTNPAFTAATQVNTAVFNALVESSAGRSVPAASRS